LFHGQVAGEECHSVRCRSDPDAAMFPFGASPLQIALPISFIGGLTDTQCCRLEPQFRNAGSQYFLVDVAALLSIKVPGFTDDGFGDPFTQLPDGELGIGVGQLKPPCPGGVQSPGCDHGGESAGQTDLFGDATPNRLRVHISSKLFSDLGLSEPHRLGRLQCGGDGPKLLQPANPINPSRIRGSSVISDSFGEFGQHLI